MEENKIRIKQQLNRLVTYVRLGYDCSQVAEYLDSYGVSWQLQNLVGYLAQFSDLYNNSIVNLSLKGMTLEEFNTRFNLNL